MVKLNNVIKGLFELHKLGHPHVEYATIYFPIRAIRYFEKIATNSSNQDLIRKILKFKTEHGNILI